MLSEEGITEKKIHSNVTLAVYIITFVVGFPTNVLAFYTFVKKVRQKATPMDILLLNLSISDLLFLFFLPFKMKEAADNLMWYMPRFLCPLSNFVFYTTIYNSTLFLTAISVERYLGVAFPIKYKLKRRPLYAVVTSFLFWVISMGHISIVYIMQHFDHSNTTRYDLSVLNVCYMDFSDEQKQVLMPVRLELFLILFCVPFLICCFCYINFVRILSKLPNIRPQKRHRAIGMALGTLLMFVICFAPYNVSHVVGYVNWKTPAWRVEALLSSTLNAALDPLIFYFSSSALRATYRTFWKRLVEKMEELCCCHKALHFPLLSCSKAQESTQSSNDSSL